MESISIKNLRSLVNIDNIVLSPITVLVGKNSSGKSSFLRTFPLLKQSIETKTSVPILWYGDYVDFGDFKTAKNNSSSCDSIEFGFDINVRENERIRYQNRFYHDYIQNVFQNEIIIKINFEINEKHITKLMIQFADQKIQIEMKSDSDVVRVIINNEEMKNKDLQYIVSSNLIIPYVFSRTSKEEYTNVYRLNYIDELIAKIKGYAHKTTKDNSIIKTLHNIKLSDKKGILSFLINAGFPQVLKRNLEALNIHNDEFESINNLIIASKLNDIIGVCNSHLTASFLSVKYIKPVRANADRYYRVQGLSIDDIDSSGNNIPMFLYNLHENEKTEFEKWTLERFGLQFLTLFKEGQGHVSLVMKDKNTGECYNLADTGYGYSQILPIIVILWKASRNYKYEPRLQRASLYQSKDSLIVIEQPELHLHPAFQAKLVDVFAKIINESNAKGSTRIRILFETHSETMINRLGYLVYKNHLKREDVNVVMFNKDDNQNTTAKTMSFSENGTLKEWPIGFFATERL